MSLQDALPDHSINEWSHDLLVAMGVPANATNMDTLEKWANRESGGYNPHVAGGRFNPLNSTESHFGYAGNGGSQGNIKDYASYQQGIQNQAWNLTHTRGAGYEAIIAGFMQSNQAATFAAIDHSAFGTHGLGSDSALPANAGGIAHSLQTQAQNPTHPSFGGTNSGLAALEHAVAHATGVDSDHDGLSDQYEIAHHLNPHDAYTYHDGIPDSVRASLDQHLQQVLDTAAGSHVDTPAHLAADVSGASTDPFDHHGPFDGGAADHAHDHIAPHALDHPVHHVDVHLIDTDPHH
jgi:hypothetical protein